MLEVYYLDEYVSMLTLKRWLCISYFTYSLDKIFFKSYLEMLAHVQKYIHMDKGAPTWWEIDRKPRKKQAQGSLAEPDPKRPTHPTDRVPS